MNILHVVQGYTPAIGGTELQIQRISEELVRQFGDKVTVFTSDCYNAGGFVKPTAPRIPVGWEEINGVKVRRFRAFNLAGPVLKPIQWLAFKLGLPLNEYLRVWYSGPHLSGLAGAIRQYPADIVTAASFPLLHMFTALKSARQAGRPVILVGNQHPEDPWGYQRPMIDAAIRQADAYIAMTEYEAQYVTGRGADPGRVFTVGSGVDMEPFGSISRQDARLYLGLPGEAPLIGFIGQLGRHKGVDTLLNVMPTVWQEVPEVNVLIAGARTSFQRHLEAILSAWPSEFRQRVFFRYNFAEAEKPKLFSSIDIFAYPSGFESFGIAFLEAWAAGKPVIGCRRGAVPWVIKHETDGLLVNYQHEQELAAALLELLRYPEQASALGEAGKRKVLEKYTWPKIAGQFRAIYDRAIHSRRKAG
jgi:glycosyltransferase involved in cell wall biosynthesis